MSNGFSFGRSKVSDKGPCYVIAEISRNHQGSLETAQKPIKTAVAMGAHAVKFQKRGNKTLFTKEMYNKPYENPNSYGDTYGEHREFLEFGMEHISSLRSVQRRMKLSLCQRHLIFQV